MRDQVFGRRVFVRGVVEVSNFCRQNCAYCGMRRDNRSLARYRLEADRLLEFLVERRPASLTDLNIQAGEDPVAVDRVVLPLLEGLRAHTPLGLSVSLGLLSTEKYAALHSAGARYYVIKLETPNDDLYSTMQAPGTFAQRLAAIRHLADTGWYVSSGFIAGLPGERPGDTDAALRLLRDLPLAGSSVSPFVPGNDTPLASSQAAVLDPVLDSLARMRLDTPLRIIPAVSAMEIARPGGYVQALRAGANLATINLTPPDARDNYVIYRRDRAIMTEERILRRIEKAQCAPSRVGILEWLGRSSSQPLDFFNRAENSAASMSGAPST